MISSKQKSVHQTQPGDQVFIGRLDGAIEVLDVQMDILDSAHDVIMGAINERTVVFKAKEVKGK